MAKFQISKLQVCVSRKTFCAELLSVVSEQSWKESKRSTQGWSAVLGSRAQFVYLGALMFN